MAESSKRILMGAVAGAHGVRGEVRIRAFTAEPAAIAAYGPLFDERGRSYRLTELRTVRDGVIARIAGIADREAATALRGTRLYVERAALPAPAPDEFYHADLIGLAVILADGRPFGRVRGVQNHGAGDILEIETVAGRTVPVPFTKVAFPAVDPAAGRVVLAPPAGLLDPAESEAPPARRRRRA